MARRSWHVGPDQLVEQADGSQIAVVSREAQMAAIEDAVVMCDRGGGVLSVLYGRQRTAMDGEAVTTELIVTWQDRAAAKPQPEQEVALTQAPELEAPPEPSDDEEPTEDEGEPDEAPEPALQGA